MFLKLFNLSLAQIKRVMVSSQKSNSWLYKVNDKKLFNKQKWLSDLIIFLDKTLAAMKEKAQMNNTEKFFSFSEEDFNHAENIKEANTSKVRTLSWQT